MMEKKFSVESQKLVGPQNSSSQQIIQRHNFLLPKDESTSIHSPSYRGIESKKSKSPIAGEKGSKGDSSIGQFDSRGFSSDKRSFGFGK